MPLPNKIDINRKRGDTKPMRFTIKNPDGTDTVINNFSFLLTVNSEKRPTDNTNRQFELTGAVDSNGNFSFTPSAVNVDLLGTYYYDVQMVTPDSLIYTLYEGKIKFTQDITK